MALFQGGTLELENPQSREEDEELEEQRRRQEELTDLLAAGIHAFNYDESTINSSVTSFEGGDQNNGLESRKNCNSDGEKRSAENISAVLEQNYKDTDQQDQLKVLYEVRGREIKKLVDEFNQYKEEKSKEISVLKNKVTLSEAEIRHLQISLSNAEHLLVEKIEMINNLQKDVNAREEEIDKLKKINDELKLEICTYTSTVNELHLKLANNNPFSSEARKFKSDEFHKSLQDKILKLESLLQEQSRKTQNLEKEKCHLEEELKKLITQKNKNDEENNFTIMELSKKLQSSQQQCRDLYLLGEAIKKESDHFKDRIQQMEHVNLDLSNDDIKTKKIDKETLLVHLEKLKKMLLDKDIEMDTLKAKLKFYTSDLDELFEYRKLLNQIYSCEIKPCSNMEHEELLIFMQRQLQSYQQAVEDRNNQIMNLNMVNQELQEKIEEMIQQTRNDIQNISQRYSLPQLETMSNELKNAEKTIVDLQKQLSERDELYKSIQQELEQVQQDYKYLQQTAQNEKLNSEKALSEIKNNFIQLEEEKEKVEKLYEEMKKHNAKIKAKIQKVLSALGLSEEVDVEEFDDIDGLDKLCPIQVDCGYMVISFIKGLEKQISHCLNWLQNEEYERAEIEKTLKNCDDMLMKFIDNLKNNKSTSEEELKDNIQELKNAKTLLEGEKCTLEYQLKSCNVDLEKAKVEIEGLVEDKKDLMKKLENNAHAIQNLNDQLNHLKKCMKIVEESKVEIEKQLENTQKQLSEAKQESIILQKEVSEVNEDMVRQNLFKELKVVENMLEQERGENDVSGSDIFKKCVQAEILKAELLLRERLEEENIKKMEKIEEQYKNVLTQRTEFHNKEKEKWKNQEARYRKQFAAVLEECGRKIEELERENMDLMQQTDKLFKEYKTFRTNAIEDIEKYKKLIIDYQNKIEILNKKWVNLFELYSHNFSNIQKRSHKRIKNLQKTINMSETEIHLVESIYNEKIIKFQSEWKTAPGKI